MKLKHLLPLLAIVLSLFWFVGSAQPAHASCVVTELRGPGSGVFSYVEGRSYSIKLQVQGFDETFSIGTAPYTGSDPVSVPAGVYIAFLDNDGVCGPFFNPGDARLNGQPGDRLAVYCNNTAKPANLGVILIDNTGTGFSELKFNFDAVKAAGKAGLTLKDGLGNAVRAYHTGANTFYVAWVSGQYGANGIDIFAKAVGCIFK